LQLLTANENNNIIVVKFFTMGLLYQNHAAFTCVHPLKLE